MNNKRRMRQNHETVPLKSLEVYNGNIARGGGARNSFFFLEVTYNQNYGAGECWSPGRYLREMVMLDYLHGNKKQLQLVQHTFVLIFVNQSI